MEAGVPDYYRVTRQIYGGADREYDEVTVDPNAETPLVTVTGKGVIYGGYCFIKYTSTQKQGVVRPYVDGKIIADISFGDLLKYGIVGTKSYPVSLCALDEQTHLYSVAITFGITFEASVKLAYREFDGTTPTVDYNLIYALL